VKIYIAGKITDNPDYKTHFARAEKRLAENHTVMNPAVLPLGFDYEDYMRICFAMIDVCDAVYMLDNWRDSPGAIREYEYAKGKEIIFEGVEYVAFYTDAEIRELQEQIRIVDQTIAKLRKEIAEKMSALRERVESGKDR